MKVWSGEEVEGFNLGARTLFVEEQLLTEETVERLEGLIDKDCVLYFGAAEKKFVDIQDDFLKSLRELIYSKQRTGINVSCVFEMSLQDVIVFSSRVSSYKVITRVDEEILRPTRPLKIRRGNDIYIFDGKSVAVNHISNKELACMRYKNDKIILED